MGGSQSVTQNGVVREGPGNHASIDVPIHILAEIAHQAYLSKALNVQECDFITALEYHETSESVNDVVFGLLLKYRPTGRYIVAYKGTQSDLSFYLYDFGIYLDRTSIGEAVRDLLWEPFFWTTVALCSKSVNGIEDIDPGALLLTGHSLGGAVALYVSSRLVCRSVGFANNFGLYIENPTHYTYTRPDKVATYAAIAQEGFAWGEAASGVLGTIAVLITISAFSLSQHNSWQERFKQFCKGLRFTAEAIASRAALNNTMTYLEKTLLPEVVAEAIALFPRLAMKVIAIFASLKAAVLKFLESFGIKVVAGTASTAASILSFGLSAAFARGVAAFLRWIDDKSSGGVNTFTPADGVLLKDLGIDVNAEHESHNMKNLRNIITKFDGAVLNEDIVYNVDNDTANKHIHDGTGQPSFTQADLDEALAQQGAAKRSKFDTTRPTIVDYGTNTSTYTIDMNGGSSVYVVDNDISQDSHNLPSPADTAIDMLSNVLIDRQFVNMIRFALTT